MSIRHKDKRVEICLTVGTICLAVGGLCGVLATPEPALAKRPGDAGTAPVCVTFEGGGGVQSDGSPYCDDKQLKVEAIMTQDGHVNLQPNTGKGGERKLHVDMDLVEDNPDIGIVSTEVWRFLVGGWNESFDMRDMDIDEVRNDVNLIINTYGPDGSIWRLIFDPIYDRWSIDYSESTHIRVTRMDETTWKIQNTTGELDESGDLIPSQAVRVIQTEVAKNKSEFAYGGVVTVPLFMATVTLVPSSGSAAEAGGGLVVEHSEPQGKHTGATSHLTPAI